MVSHAHCLPKCDYHVQDVIAVRAMTQMPPNPFNTHHMPPKLGPNPFNTHYYTLLHTTTYYYIHHNH